MTVRAVGYAYPWDFLDDPGAADRVARLDLDAVAVAANYHAVRAATPWHPGRRLVRAEHAACYLPLRPAAWRGRRLVPAAASWLPTRDAFGSARTALRGRPVYAWTVLTHNSLLGGAHPDLVVRNAFGEPYEYALCPLAEEVADYCVTTAAEVVTVGEPAGVVLEACGPLGVGHLGHHDKTDLAGWSPVRRQLLSLCFCAACRVRQSGAGLDPDAVASAVRAALSPTAEPASVEQALGECAPVLERLRTDAVRALRARVVAAVRAVEPGLRVVLHASADPWATGPFATVAGGVGAPVDALVAGCWQQADAERELAGLRGSGPRVGGYLLADGSWAAGDPAERLARYRAAGMAEAHLYHLGLVGPAGLRLIGSLAALQRAHRG